MQEQVKNTAELKIRTPFPDHPEVLIRFARYCDGGAIAMRMVALDGEPFGFATVNIPKQAPAKNCVWLKGWFENEWVPDALVEAGIVELTGRGAMSGHALAEEAELTPKALEVLAATQLAG